MFATLYVSGTTVTPVVQTPDGSPDSGSPEDGSNHTGQLESQRSVDSDKGSPTQVLQVHHGP